MERICGFFIRKRKSINEGLIMYAVAMLANIYSGQYASLKGFLTALVDSHSFSAITMWIAVLILILFQFLLKGMKAYSLKQSRGFQLRKAMQENMPDCFDLVKDRNGYCWGADRTVIVCDNIFEGWKAENVVIEELKCEKYQFEKQDQELEKEFQLYCNSETARDIVARGNNNERYMITKYSTNFSKHDKKLFLSLQKTEWLRNQFFWNKYRENPEQQKKAMVELYGQGKILPNSFCLHLVLVTKDDEVILTAICRNKGNDYPKTWAATIGEQIEQTDFANGVDMRESFVVNWTKRALYEEFGIYEDQFNQIIDEDGIRVLSLNAEGDIYNLSLMTVAHLRVSFDEFMIEVHKHPEMDHEFNEIKALKIKEIPSVIYSLKNKSEALKYHPSTFLRLFMCYIHRYGIKAFMRQYEKIK